MEQQAARHYCLSHIIHFDFNWHWKLLCCEVKEILPLPFLLVFVFTSWNEQLLAHGNDLQKVKYVNRNFSELPRYWNTAGGEFRANWKSEGLHCDQRVRISDFFELFQESAGNSSKKVLPFIQFIQWEVCIEWELMTGIFCG